MSTDNLGRNQSPATHTPNAFSMLKKTAKGDEQKSTTTAPESEPKAKPAKRSKAAARKTPPPQPKTAAADKETSNGGVETVATPREETTQPTTKPGMKERPTELITLYLPLDLRDSFKHQAKTEKTSHPSLAFTAIEVAYPHLADLLNQYASGPTKTPTVSLFQRSGGQTRGRTSHTKDHGDLQFRITRTNAAILDNLVEEFEAPSRSVLITLAIRYYLDYPITDDE